MNWVLLNLSSTQKFPEQALLILQNTQYFRGVDTVYTQHYAGFSRRRYYLYYTIRSIFVGSLLLILGSTQNFLDEYYFSSALRIVLEGWILLILSNIQQIWGSILLILKITLQLCRVNTPDTQQFAAFQGSRYCLQ